MLGSLGMAGQLGGSDHATRITLLTGSVGASARRKALLARQSGFSPVQLALAWLLRRSPVMLPIPGTSSVPHLEENLAAADVMLDEQAQRELTAAQG